MGKSDLINKSMKKIKPKPSIIIKLKKECASGYSDGSVLGLYVDVKDIDMVNQISASWELFLRHSKEVVK